MNDSLAAVRLVLGALGVGAAHLAMAQDEPANAPTQGCIELKTLAQTEEPYTDENGNPATHLVPAAKVVPGDEVVWTIVADNICAAPAENVAITNPVPAHMTYLGDTAFGPGASITFSLDGESFAPPAELTVLEPDGSVRQARVDEYSHIRWALERPIGPRETLLVRYRAVVL